jgi:hypothetical protein
MRAARAIATRGDGPITAQRPRTASGPKRLAAARWGNGPADGFTGERSQDPVDNGVEGWGDCGAAVAAADGSIWFANEEINQSCSVAQLLSDTTCGGTRTILADWGTYIDPTSTT